MPTKWWTRWFNKVGMSGEREVCAADILSASCLILSDHLHNLSLCGSSLCWSLPLSSIVVVPTHLKHFFFLNIYMHIYKLDAGQPIAGLGWMDWCYQCLGRWSVGYCSILKKRNTDRSLCVWGRGVSEIVLIKWHKRKPSFFLWAPGDRLWTYLL